MTRLKVFLSVLILCCLSLKMNAQYISIDDQRTPQQLIENVLVNSSCATTSNSSGKGDTFTVGQQSYAYFNAGSSSFPFAEGIILTTSPSRQAVGPYVSNNGGGNVNWTGDSDLNNILGINSINATVLEFDFVPLTDVLSFNYIFASNEYQSFFPCEYSDGFAFLIKEVGTSDPYKNLAVLPNSTIPVSSTNVRPKIEPGVASNGDPYPGCPAVNQNYFNGLNNNTTSPINYAGQTIVMNARTNVVAGKKYHIKLVIADDKNQYYDSAVFLQAGSFSSKIDFGADQTALSGNPLCFGEEAILDTKLSASYDFKWYKDGVLLPSEKSPVLHATTSGVYKADVTLTPSTCTLTGEVKIEVAPEILSTNTTLVQCDDNNDGISVFDLKKVDNLIKNNASDITNSGYYETLANAQSKSNPIVNPEKYTNKSANQIVYGRIENKFGCFKTVEVKLQTSNNAISAQNPVKTCDGDDKQDGLYQFDLQAQVTPQLTTGLPAGLEVHYFLSSNDALTETNILPNIFKNTIAFTQTIYARIINGADCYSISPVTLVVNTFDPPNFEEESKYICKNSDITLSVAAGFNSYLWSPGAETSNLKTITAPGDYSVTVTDANGCQKTKKFKVILSEPAIITEAVVKDFSGVDNSVLIKYTGSGDYEFSLDGNVFQDEPQFNGIEPGIYYAVARDKNGCGLSNRFLVYVLDYPRFFTPNNDGYNDLWAIKDINQMPAYTIRIFDRYGKFLKQMNQSSTGWNGLFNGEQLPADDYWFTLLFVDGKSVKGHFSLKR
ncbi:gliding motility-associated C-terminal domain-containing protein [Flavobacterium resistens]|uniref:Gliding motility-associated C-terminal domain-containing protein n=2 Tax=Flavobacterium resistens TaxID=443612 RepID=A0A521DPQ4_9FLAO|nr:T9SS type B sorting domain-containing protein [Flavobacterium resistens]SMO73676.1 gliding motility-associated C-terminal domain-containing protein [Flavobacterium resistens]